MFEASRAKAINQLDNFVENNLAEYSRLRNFDFGPEKRLNVSCLSPYITHGIINEKEVIQKSLSKFSFSKNEKFIQEVLWRTYWKGWLELRPNVWTDYLLELKQIKNEFKNNKDYLENIQNEEDQENRLYFLEQNREGREYDSYLKKSIYDMKVYIAINRLKNNTVLVAWTPKSSNKKNIAYMAGGKISNNTLFFLFLII